MCQAKTRPSKNGRNKMCRSNEENSKQNLKPAEFSVQNLITVLKDQAEKQGKILKGTPTESFIFNHPFTAISANKFVLQQIHFNYQQIYLLHSPQVKSAGISPPGTI